MLNQAIPGKLIVLFVGLLFLSYVAAETATAASSRKNAARGPGQKNVIVLMTDGTGAAHTTITRWYKGAPLALDRMFYSQMRTYSVDSLITDSAPAATAFATGYKSNDKYVGIYPSE
ncbi:MAG: alkaline phosphatase, partial [Desulfobacteraceae bacterium]